MECITFMHRHQPLLNSGMTPFGLPRKHNQGKFLEDKFGTLLFKNLSGQLPNHLG
jgi:hypothetical protein